MEKNFYEELPDVQEITFYNSGGFKCESIQAEGVEIYLSNSGKKLIIAELEKEK